MMGIAECPLCRHGNKPDKAGNIYDLGDKCPLCKGTKRVRVSSDLFVGSIIMNSDKPIDATEEITLEWKLSEKTDCPDCNPTIGEILDGQEGE